MGGDRGKQLENYGNMKQKTSVYGVYDSIVYTRRNNEGAFVNITFTIR